MARLRGSMEEKYEILEKLRQGGMGAVYKARHRLLDEIRALKVLRSWALGTEEAQARFLREARVASRLRHPNLAVLHDFAVDEDGDAYLVSEFIDGWTLRELLRRLGPPPLSLGLEIGRQGLKALGYLHRQRIVHRDISPDNLMLTRDADGLPLVKLIDLGIAKALEDGSGATETGVFLGKPRYASPEQFGEAPVDERSDLYSFGVVLYELLTGRCPISGHDALSLMAGHLQHPPLSFEESDPEGRIPHDLRALLLGGALEKRPDDRVPTADDFAMALLPIQARYPVSGEEIERLFGPQASAAVAEAGPEDAVEESSHSLYLRDPRAPESDTTRSGALPLALAAPLAAEASRVDEVTWGGSSGSLGSSGLPGEPAEQGLAYEPLEEPGPVEAVPAAVTRPESAEGWSLLFRLAVSMAALLALFVLARGFWWPDPETQEWAAVPRAPQNTAAPVRPRVTPPTVQPAPTLQEPAEETAEVPEVVEEPAQEDLTLAEEVEAPEPSPVPAPAAPAPAPRPRKPEPSRAPEPVLAEEASPKPALPAPAPVLARRLPPVWEEDSPRRDLLKPGPGVEQPVPLDFPRYNYPSDARGTGLRPDVRLAVLVDERGRVIDARVREGAPEEFGFAETAIAVAKRIPFQPATRYDIPGKMWTEVILEFVE